MTKKSQKLLSVTEAAQKLGVSRTYILKLIQTGKLSAQKVGRAYIIAPSALPGIYRPITEAEKHRVEKAVDRTLKEFGDVIKKLAET